MEFVKVNFRNILIVLILLIGIAVAVLVAQNQQIFKSRANATVVNFLSVKDESGNNINASKEGDRITVPAGTRSIQVQLDQQAVEDLTNSLP